MRRGQLLSLDALVALVVVIFILSAVTSASQNIESGLSSMLGWYERTNLADNMLDVLINTPGEPSNWTENLSVVRVPGLRSINGQYVDYNKITTLFDNVHSGNSTLLNALWNLSGHNNFRLTFYFVNSSISANYSFSASSILPSMSSILEICSLSEVKVLPNDTSIVIYCPTGTFYFSHSGVSYNYYGNPYSVCVLNSAFVGNNFNLYVGQTFSVNGSLRVASDGSVNTSSLYVNGNLSVANSGTLSASNVAYINGSLYIAGSGNVADVGTLYVYGSAYIGNSGFLNATGSVYILKNTTIASYGVATIRGSYYEYSNLTLANGAYLSVGGSTYIGGNLLARGISTLSSNGSVYIVGNASLSSSKVLSNGSVYINGPLYLGQDGVINASGDVYINGNATVYGTIVGRNIYVNGSLEILGYTGWVSARENLVVNGSVVIQGSNSYYALKSGNTTVIFDNLIISNLTVLDGVEIEGSLYVGENFTTGKSSNVPVSVGDKLVVGQYLNLTSSGVSLTVGKNAYIGYQVYANGTITINDGSMFVYYGKGYPDVYSNEYFYYGVVLGPREKSLTIHGGYLYFYDDKWYALEGYLYSDSDYDMAGYKQTITGYVLSAVYPPDKPVHKNNIWYVYSDNNTVLVIYPFSITLMYNYEAPLKLVSYSSTSLTADVLIDPNGASLVTPNQTLPQVPPYANISPSTWIYSLPPVPPFEVATCNVPQTTSSLSLNVTSLNVSYIYPSLSQLSSSYFQISMINGSPVNNTLAVKSMNSSSWIEQASRIVAVRMFLYSREYNLTPMSLPKALYGGMLQFPPIGYLRIEVPNSKTGNFTLVSTYVGEDYSGYSLLVVASINNTVVYGFASSEVASCNVKVSGTVLLVPWKCLVPFGSLNGGVTFTIWAYSMAGYPWVYLQDIANMNIYMRPVYNYGLIKVLIWGG
ncbi:hypothetical protein [Thermococcus sp.]|uniref:hypothetical protein n=1 Tax=Thermococcus sp. TaxID=35749 RepID=UPI00260D49F2|nr:hypothetical protein [Thermococcus sp.]